MTARRRVLALAVACLAVAAGASARHRHRDAAAAPGVFDYYLLSLSWSPAFCLQSPGAAECSGARRYGFIVHGLWPQYERGWPEHCADAGPLPDAVADRIADLMPARGLVFHEWSTHGACSGLDPADYFDVVRRAYESVRLPVSFTGAAAAAPVERATTAIVRDFLEANPRLPPRSVVATCSGQGVPRLREVHVCLTRELAPRECPPDALREACRADSVIVPPIR